MPRSISLPTSPRSLWVSGPFDLCSDRGRALEHLGVGLGSLNPGLDCFAYLFGDAAVVQLGDDVQLGAGALGHADRERADLIVRTKQRSALVDALLMMSLLLDG